jgi:hypothetical protein
MRTLETARNIVNADEVESWLKQQFGSRYPDILLWVTSVVRKWIIKNAPAQKAVVPAQDNMPAWLRTAIEKDDALEEILLDGALEARIQPVLDYMQDLVTTKPDTNVAAIGFDIAEQRSEKWHARLAKPVKEIVAEDGATPFITYPDGFTWRRVEGKDALVREGQMMGHCVGRMNYHQMVLRAKTDIVSLRDQQNEPHVTIEIGEQGTVVHQIKGKANGPVLPKYLKYVSDFLKTRTWTRISFDGAFEIREEILEHQLTNAPPWFQLPTLDTLKVVINPRPRYGVDKSYVIIQDNKTLGEFSTYVNAAQTTCISDFTITKEVDAVPELLRKMCVEKSLRISTITELFPLMWKNTRWSQTDGWCAPKNQAAQDLMYAVCGTKDEGDVLYIDDADKLPAAWYSAKTNNLYTQKATNTRLRQDLALSLAKPAECWIGDSFLVRATHDVNFSAWTQKQVAGKSVAVGGSDVDLLNTLLSALKQPDAATIKSGYVKLKAKTKITDQDLKALGFPTSGRAINAIGAVLLCSLPIKNAAPFRSYVFNKPNTMTAWAEMLAQPQHLLHSLTTYGLTSDAIKQIVDLLRNEFLRLVPTDSEIEELDLDLPVKGRLLQALVYAKSHRQNAARSKELWAKL